MDSMDRYSTDRTPPRPPEQRVGNPRPGQPSKATVCIKFTGTRTGVCYTGNVLKDDGTLGDAVRFVIDNDPGTYSLPDDTIVTAEKAPARLADAAIWSGSGDKYRAISTAPFSQLT